MNAFWSLWIISLTVLTVIGLCWILFANRKTTGGGPDATTGHSYDGIDEYDNPLPVWWFYLFVITLVFAFAYVIVFPGLGAFGGVIGWSSAGQLQRDAEKAEAQYGPLFTKFANMPIAEAANDTQALSMGQRLFANNCAQCHGADARGSFGFPNLADNDWLYGGAPEHIEQTIAHGRSGAMPAWESALGNRGVIEVANYVLALSGRIADEKSAQAGKEKFAMYCTGCHGADGKGNIAMGAPNLTDAVWLYGGSPLMIQQTIRGGRGNLMPEWNKRLGKERVHLLAAYVYSLSRAQ